MESDSCRSRRTAQDAGKLRRSETLPCRQHQQFTIFIRHAGKRDARFQTVLFARVQMDTEFSTESVCDLLKEL